jgi:hypothetical protein
VLQIAQRVTKAANGLTAHRTRSCTPFQERLLRARNRLVIIVVRCSKHTCDSPPVNRRNLIDLRATAAPLAIEDAFVYISEIKFFKN